MGQLQSEANGCVYERAVLAEKYALEYGFKEVILWFNFWYKFTKLFIC